MSSLELNQLKTLAQTPQLHGFVKLHTWLLDNDSICFEGGWWRSQIIRRAESLVLYKSFNTLLHGAYTLYCKQRANLRADHLWPVTILLIQVHNLAGSNCTFLGGPCNASNVATDLNNHNILQYYASVEMPNKNSTFGNNMGPII